MKKGLRTALSLLFVSSLTVVAACGGTKTPSGSSSPAPSGNSSSSPSDKPAGKTVTLTHVVTGDSPSRDKWLKALAEKAGANIDIQLLPLDKFEEIYKVKAATKDLPDIISYHPGARMRDDLQASKALADLSDLPGVKNINEGLLPFYKDNGKVYGIPAQGVKFGGILYNKKVFKEVGVDIPQSLDELIKASEKIKKAGKIPFYLSAKDSWTLQIPGLTAFSYDQLQNKGLLDKINANQASFKDAKNFIDAYKTLKTLISSGYVNSDFLSASYANAQQAMTEGKAAMYPVLSSIVGTLADTAPDKVDDLGFFLWPVAGEKVATSWPPMIFGIPADSKNKEKAKEFINYFMTNDGQKQYFEYQPSAGVPALKGVQLDESKLKEPVRDMIKISNTTKQFATFDFSVITNIGAFGDQVQAMLMDQKTPEQLAETLTDTLKKNAKAKGIPGF
ncbi:extracellular solute-binding protein [Paenibacillus sp. MZ04-78.2]|uniref:ABC transporter substrate-binding protein n=1 Tax=Paenibacillus sp. MZ04-78.2 TaxID=2962034 RepID=UPI0020B65EB9|nr:extracellular solute-binding protein [Paenibacillus sp. MZ04-78.2]MCP3775768.1 extracellular solute-binding protein [Paenibacillus sp. MZ04-78.2]